MTNLDNENLVERETVIINVSQLHNYIDSPHFVRLDLPGAIKKLPYDIGAFAYAKRDKEVNSTTEDKPIKVALGSYKPERKYFLVALFDHLAISGWRDSTILSLLVKIRIVLDFCDSNGFSNLFESEDAFAEAYAAYTDYLFDQIRFSKIKPSGAREMQKTMEKIVSIWLDKNAMYRICSNVTEIKAKRAEADAPDEQIIKNTVRVFLHIAREYGASVLELKPFPWLLKMPDYETYVFPGHFGSIKTPYMAADALVYRYDYESGQEVTYEEYIQNGGTCTAKDFRTSSKDLKKHLDKSNSEGLDNLFRKNNATLAMLAYMQIFMMLTGAYFSEIAQIEIDNELDVDRCIVNNNFRAVKFRANGKVVLYNLGEKIGLNILKEYLKLREFVLRGRKCKYLFFQMIDTDEKGELKQHDDRSARKVYQRTNGIFFKAGTSNVTTRDIRKHKSVVLHELRINSQHIANNLNHQTQTNLKHYIPTSPEKMKNEFSNFWTAIKKAASEIPIVNIEQQHPDDISIPVGHCSNKNNPIPMRKDVPIEPDCKKQYGCLYCNQFLIHADKTDIHKLLSVKFVVEQVLLMTDNEIQAEKLLREVVVRIDYLIDRLKELSSTAKELVETVHTDVFDYGELTPFWTYRLARYEQMGVLA